MGEKSFSFLSTFYETQDWYHGTTSDNLNSLKEGVQVDFNPRKCDFGIGFYMTSRKEQAEKWAKRKASNLQEFDSSIKPIVLTYRVILKETKIFEIDLDFFKFIYQNRVQLNARTGKNNHKFPSVFGPVIDGNVTQLRETLENLQSGNINIYEASDTLLGSYKKDTQLCICEQSIADSMILSEVKYLC